MESSSYLSKQRKSGKPIKGLLVTAVALTMVATALSIAQAAPVSVLVSDNRFEPANVQATVGQPILWDTSASTRRSHNVRQNDMLFYSGFAATDFTYRRVFSAGTFGYYCEIHGSRSSGMNGTVKVPVKLIAGPAGPDFLVVWATADTNTGTKFTVQYKVGSKAWKTWKDATSARKATFGSAQLGTRYSFRAKSLKNGNASKWSPVESINA